MEVRTSKRFKQDLKICSKQGKDLNKLNFVLNLLKNGEKIPPNYHDHKLTGNFKNCRELHIEPDWLLVYMFQDNVIILLLATGTHAKTLKL